MKEKIISLIEVKWSPKTTRREVGYVATIQELLKTRNRIAHGESNVIVTDVELSDFICNIRQLAKGIDELLTGPLSVLRAS